MTHLSVIDLTDGTHAEGEATAFLRKLLHPVPSVPVYGLVAPALIYLTDSADDIHEAAARITEDTEAGERPDRTTLRADVAATGTETIAPTPAEAEEEDDDDDESLSTAPAVDVEGGVSVDLTPTGEIPAINPEVPFDALNTRPAPGDSPLREYLNPPVKDGRGAGIDRPQDILPWLFSRAKGSHASR